MMNNKLLWGIFFFAVLPALFAFEVAPGANLKRLVNRPEAIHCRVDSVKEGEDVWISMEVDVHVCTEIPFEAIKKTITDYNSYTAYFKRTTASEILRGNGGSEVYMQLSVGAMGISFVTNYTILITKEIDEPGCLLLRFSHLADDGTVRNVRGYWYFKQVDIGGKTHTYIRHYSASDSIRKSALQKMATSMFAESEYMGILKELLAAARR
jgi:hypothetical protein